jgi:Leucine-rich repeat (LRR) protein
LFQKGKLKMPTPRVLLLLSASALLCAADGTEWIASLGGRVQRDTTGNVVAVNLRGAWVDDVEMIDVARLPKLERLDLSHTRITDEGMLNLKPATGIRDLNLYYSEWITDQGMTAIKNWKMLKRLNVRGTRIANGTLEIVSHMPQLEALDVSNTQITDNGLDLLIAMTGLKELALGRSRVGEGDLGFLRMLPSLTSLDLSGARPTPPDMGGAGGRGAGAVPTMPQSTIRAMAELKNLRVLKLGFSGISANDLKALSVLENVEKLGLEECPRVDDTAAAELANWKSLKYLDVQDTKVTAKGLAELRKAKPGLVVVATPETKPKG